MLIIIIIIIILCSYIFIFKYLHYNDNNFILLHHIWCNYETIIIINVYFQQNYVSTINSNNNLHFITILHVLIDYYYKYF